MRKPTGTCVCGTVLQDIELVGGQYQYSWVANCPNPKCGIEWILDCENFAEKMFDSKGIELRDDSSGEGWFFEAD